MSTSALWALWVAAVGAIGSMIAAWILVSFTKTQVKTLISDYRDSRLNLLAARFQASESLLQVTREWSEQAQQEGDRLKAVIADLDNVQDLNGYTKVVRRAAETALEISENLPISAATVDPIYVLQIERLHAEMVDSAKEIKRTLIIFLPDTNDQAGGIDDKKETLSDYLEEISNELIAAARKSLELNSSILAIEPDPRTAYERAKANIV